MADARSSNGGMLTSWKEIASFFNREVRTVQRWEREEGLPVHRHRHQRQSSVYAFPAELEAWWRERHFLDFPADGGETTGEPARDPPMAGPPATNGGRKRLAGVTLGVLALAAVVLVALTWRPGTGTNIARPPFPVRLLATPGAQTLEVLSLSDLNGDGRDDVVLVTHSRREASIHLGRGPAQAPSEPDVRITSVLNGELGGGGVGDVDGDGLSDLVLSVFLNEPETFHATGPGYLLRGRRVWPARLELPGDADTTFDVGLSKDIRLGVCPAGDGIDLNGDGLHDLRFGGTEFSPPARASAGGVFVLYGRRTWPAKLDLLAADITIHGSRTGEGLSPYCAAGDFNGDRKVDLALVANEDTLWGLLGGRGRCYVLAGRGEWPRVLEAERDAALRVTGTVGRARLNASLQADVNGDGFDDLVTGVPVDRQGRVVIVFGGRESRPVRSVDEADVVITGGSSRGEFGSVVATDLNLDGRGDLIVGEPGHGTIQLILGRPRWAMRGSSADYDAVTLLAGKIGAGAPRMAVGDFDGDNAVDVVFTAGRERAGEPAGPALAAVLTPYLPITVDVRPGKQPNVVLLGTGVLVVSVSSRSAAFTDLDPMSFRLAGAPPTHSGWQDFDNDGKADLVLHFDTAALRLRPDLQRLALIGRTRQGLPVAGADDVTVMSSRQTTSASSPSSR